VRLKEGCVYVYIYVFMYREVEFLDERIQGRDVGTRGRYTHGDLLTTLDTGFG